MILLVLQSLAALVVLVSLRPPRNPYLGAVAAFFGMMVNEGPVLLAVPVLLMTGLPFLGEAPSGAVAWTGIGLGIASLLGLAWIIARSTRVAPAALAALAHLPEDSRAPMPSARLRSLLLPFSVRPGVPRTVTRDIVYGDAPGKRNLLDVHRAAGELPSGAPVLVQIHGGSWSWGNKEQQGQPLISHLVERGWVCVSINYRLSPADAWPAHVIDVKKAIAWVKENIHLHGGNPEHVVLTGGSAGGHLTALAALTPNDPAYQPGFESADTSVVGAVPLYTPTDLAALSSIPTAPGLRDFVAKRVFQTDPVTDRDAYVAASPLARVSEDAPDFFVLHGLLDSSVDIAYSAELVERLRAVSSRDVSWLPVPGGQHSFDVFRSVRVDATVEAIGRWLTHHHDRRLSR